MEFSVSDFAAVDEAVLGQTPAEVTAEQWIALRNQVDTALACYLRAFPKALPSRVGVLELIGWLSEQEMKKLWPEKKSDE